MSAPTLFRIEVYTRFRALPPEHRVDPMDTLLRITAELTIEWMQNYPEGITEFLKFANGNAERRPC